MGGGLGPMGRSYYPQKPEHLPWWIITFFVTVFVVIIICQLCKEGWRWLLS